MYSSTFLDLGTRWRSASSACRFTPEKRAPSAHWIGGWVGRRAGLHSMGKTELLPLDPRLSGLKSSRYASTFALVGVEFPQGRRYIVGGTAQSSIAALCYVESRSIPFSQKSRNSLRISLKWNLNSDENRKDVVILKTVLHCYILQLDYFQLIVPIWTMYTRRLVTNCSRYLHCHEVTLPIEAEQVRRNTAQYTVLN
jgi:hypothetical protein